MHNGNVLGSGGSHAPRLCTFGTTLEGVHGTVDNDCAAPPPSPPFPELPPAPEASASSDPHLIGANGDAFHVRGPAKKFQHHGKASSRAKKIKNSDDRPQMGGPSVA